MEKGRSCNIYNKGAKPYIAFNQAAAVVEAKLLAPYVKENLYGCKGKPYKAQGPYGI